MLAKNELTNKLTEELLHNVNSNTLINAIGEGDKIDGKKWIWTVLTNLIKDKIWNYYIDKQYRNDNEFIKLALDYLLCKLVVCYYLCEVKKEIQPLYPKYTVRVGLANFSVDSKEHVAWNLTNIELFLKNDMDDFGHIKNNWEFTYDEIDPLDIEITPEVQKDKNAVYTTTAQQKTRKLKEFTKDYFVKIMEGIKI